MLIGRISAQISRSIIGRPTRVPFMLTAVAVVKIRTRFIAADGVCPTAYSPTRAPEKAAQPRSKMGDKWVMEFRLERKAQPQNPLNARHY